MHQADTEEGEALQFNSLLLSAGENERACEVRRRQALREVARLRLELQAARYQECIAHKQRRPLVGFDAVAIALHALNVQMKSMPGQRARILAHNFPVTNETSSVVPAVEELGTI